MSVALETHSSEVGTNQFVLLACSYKFHVQQCTMCYTKGSALRGYTIQMIHALKLSDQVARINFNVDERNEPLMFTRSVHMNKICEHYELKRTT
jgi:hypothetical protein